jgi:hypothetical protein
MSELEPTRLVSIHLPRRKALPPEGQDAGRHRLWRYKMESADKMLDDLIDATARGWKIDAIWIDSYDPNYHLIPPE